MSATVPALAGVSVAAVGAAATARGALNYHDRIKQDERGVMLRAGKVRTIKSVGKDGMPCRVPRIYGPGHCVIMPFVDELRRISVYNRTSESDLATAAFQGNEVYAVRAIMRYNITDHGVVTALCQSTGDQAGFDQLIGRELSSCTTRAIRSCEASDSHDTLGDALKLELEKWVVPLGIEIINVGFSHLAPSSAHILASRMRELNSPGAVVIPMPSRSDPAQVQEA